MNFTREKLGQAGMVASLLFTALAILTSYLFIFVFNNDRAFEPSGEFQTFRSPDQSFSFAYPQGYEVDDTNNLIFNSSNSPITAQENEEQFEGTYAIFAPLPETLSIESGCDAAREVLESNLAGGGVSFSNVESYSINLNKTCQFDYEDPARGTLESFIIVENAAAPEASQYFVLTTQDRNSDDYQRILNTIYSLNYL